MGLIRVVLAVAVLAAVGCKGNSDGGSQVAQVPDLVGSAGLNGGRADGQMALADLPESAYFQVVQPIGIDIRQLTQLGRLNQSVAYFQSSGQVSDNDGRGGRGSGWDDRAGRDRARPSIQSRSKVCALSIDSNTVQSLRRAGQRFVSLPAGLQLQIQRKVSTGGRGGNGEVNFQTLGNTAAIQNIGCDKMTVRAFEQNIFKGQIQIFIR